MGTTALHFSNSEGDCSLVNSLANDSATRCLLARSLEDCDAGRAILPYVDFLYCRGDQGASIPSLVLLVLWLATLFVALGSTASSYLCPALVHISKALQLSQGVAGVTFLAFGNGAPDTIATIASIRRDRTALAIGELFGGGTYVATIVVGLIFINNDFELIQSSLLRDVIFYLGASFWAFTLYFNGCIKLVDAVGFIALYLVYITVAVWGQKLIAMLSRIRFRRQDSASRRVSRVSFSNVDKEISQSFNSSSHSRSDKGDGEIQDLASLAEANDVVNTPPPFLTRPRLRRSSSGISLHHHHENAIYYFTASVEEEQEEVTEVVDPRRASRTSQASFNFVASSVFPGEATPLLGRSTDEKMPPTYSEWMEFLLHVSPVEPGEWKDKRFYYKIYDVLTLPISLVLVLTIPVVDHENRHANWSRPLNSLHCVSGPIVALSISGVLTARIGDLVPAWCVALTLGVALACLVWFTSSAHEPPRYHLVFAYAGFAMSIVWIYGVATEIVALLKAFGALSGTSDVILGMTVLAWGNNIGDLVTNLQLSRQGFPQMAMAACFAGPVLALLLGIGVAFSMNLVSRSVSSIELHYSELLPLIYGALVIVLFVLLLSALVTWFRSSRVVGAILILFYVLFLLSTAIVEIFLIQKK